MTLSDYCGIFLIRTYDNLSNRCAAQHHRRATMEDLATTERLMFSLLALNMRTVQQDGVRLKLVIAEAVSLLTGQHQSATTGFESLDFEDLRPLSCLLAERVHRPKYGKNRPLVTAEEIMAVNATTIDLPVDMPGNVPEDVQDSVMEAMTHEIARHKPSVEAMTWHGWQEKLALIKRLAKKRGVSIEDFFSLDDANEMLIRATTKKGDYRRRALANYQVALDMVFDSMVPAMLESTLVSLAGSGSSSYSFMADSVPGVQELMRPMRQLLRETLIAFVESDIERIYGKAD